ncbi:MAG: ABC transporter permease [Clostridia bacterium]|nr:ABC transporter permease [Clostridia bacterium]
MKQSLARIRALTGRNIKELLRDPLSLVFLILMPLGMEILFYFLFSKLTSQFQMKYLAPGIVVFSQSFLTLFSGLMIAVDRSSAFLTRLYVSSAKPHEFIFGYAFSLLPISLAQSILFFVVGGIIDPSLFSARMIAAVAVSLIPAVFFIGSGILFGSLCTEKSIGGVASILIAGQSMLSGMWYPIDGLGKGMLTLMNVLPFRPATLLVQNLLGGVASPFDDFVKPLLIVLAYTVAIFTAAIFAFGSKMKAK